MEKLINKWKLNKGLLAKKMDMPLGTFCNKLSSKHDTKFSDIELVKLKIILKELQDAISNEVEIDFNDVMKAVVNKPMPSPPIPPLDKHLTEGEEPPKPKRR